ncbi:MAG: hypothetical protein HYZ17_16365 [Betaproteobacteria bacterium]|nr:hypothetical protein [Betaproteobacteria bacterium]
MTAWSIPREWEGETVAVLASGPSMSQDVADRVRAAGIPAIVVNNTFRLAPWADILYAADAKWWDATPDAMRFAGLKVSCEPVRGAMSLRNAGKLGYSDEPDCVHTFGNSGAQAIQIGAKAGGARILLFGFDMRGGHWHGEHQKPLRNTTPASFERWAADMQTLAVALAQRGVAVINCTPGSALRCFPEGSP